MKVVFSAGAEADLETIGDHIAADAARIDVIRILHGAMDYEPLLFPDRPRRDNQD